MLAVDKALSSGSIDEFVLIWLGPYRHPENSVTFFHVSPSAFFEPEEFAEMSGRDQGGTYKFKNLLSPSSWKGLALALGHLWWKWYSISLLLRLAILLF